MTTLIGVLTVWFVFCVDVGLGFIEGPFQRKTVCMKHSSLAYRSYDDVPTLTVYNGTDLFDAPIIHEAHVPTTAKSFKVCDRLSFENDIKPKIDIDRPYYALKNEHNIVDTDTKEGVGFVCTVTREMPLSRENGSISFPELGRHSAASASVAAALKNPKKGRFHYLASTYNGIARLDYDTVLQELSDVLNAEELPVPSQDEYRIFCRCHEVTKRDAVVEFWCEMEDSFYYGEIKLNLVSATLFKKMYPPSPNNDKVSYNHNLYSYKAPRLSDSCLKIKESFNDSFVDDWITIDASIDGVKSCDCIGHFYEGGALANPHSFMLHNNVDLIGHAISKLTQREIPYKKTPSDIKINDAWGIKMLSWDCQPENLNLADSEGVLFQVRAYHSSDDGARLGDIGSKYTVQCVAKGDISGDVFYKANGTFSLAPLHWN